MLKYALMDQNAIVKNNQRNPLTHRQHRREVFWQITVPVLIGGLILLVFALMATQMGMIETSRWADISLIWLIIPMMLFGLITLALLAASVYATIKIILVLPGAAYRLHCFLIRLSGSVRTTGDRLVEPVVRVKGFSASLKSFKRQVSRK